MQGTGNRRRRRMVPGPPPFGWRYWEDPRYWRSPPDVIYPGIDFDPYYPPQMRRIATEDEIKNMEDALEGLEDEKREIDRDIEDLKRDIERKKRDLKTQSDIE